MDFANAVLRIYSFLENSNAKKKNDFDYINSMNIIT